MKDMGKNPMFIYKKWHEINVPTGWRCMNDERVNDISDDQVVTKAAYCLLYRRRKGAVNGDAMATNVSEPTTCSSAGSPSLLGGLGYSDPEEVDWGENLVSSHLCESESFF